jgi:hypothetical protein
MKSLVAVVTVVGMGSGLLLAVGALFLPIPAPLANVFLSVVGLLVAATHWGNWKQLRDPSEHRSRLSDHRSRLLLIGNLAGLLFFSVALAPAQLSLIMVGYWLLYPLPFAVNAVAPTAAGWSWIRCGLLGLVLVAVVLIWRGQGPEDSYLAVGRVLEGGTGRPLVGVRVTLGCMTSGGLVSKTLQTVSGASGAYEFKASDIRGCNSISVDAQMDGYVRTPAIDPEYGRDQKGVHILLTPVAEANMQKLAVLEMSARGMQVSNPAWHYASVFVDFFEATRIAKTDREAAFVGQSFCPLLIDLWSSLSEGDRSFIRGKRQMSRAGVAVIVDHDGAVLPYCREHAVNFRCDVPKGYSMVEAPCP